MFLFPQVVSVDEDKEVIGYLKVSLEAAKALTGIYKEFCQKPENNTEDESDEEEEEEETKRDQIQLIEYDDDSDCY